MLSRKKIEDRSFGLEDLASFSCSIIDLSKDIDSAITISTKHYEGGNATAADVLRAIRQPPRNSCARILLWSTEPKERSARILQSCFLDVCGLGLRVGPEFFAAVAHRFVVRRKIQVTDSHKKGNSAIRSNRNQVGRQSCNHCAQLYPKPRCAACLTSSR